MAKIEDNKEVIKKNTMPTAIEISDLFTAQDINKVILSTSQVPI
nr:hypothetical protein [Staphylococcus epidermidis]